MKVANRKPVGIPSPPTRFDDALYWDDKRSKASLRRHALAMQAYQLIMQDRREDARALHKQISA